MRIFPALILLLAVSCATTINIGGRDVTFPAGTSDEQILRARFLAELLRARKSDYVIRQTVIFGQHDSYTFDPKNPGVLESHSIPGMQTAKVIYGVLDFAVFPLVVINAVYYPITGRTLFGSIAVAEYRPTPKERARTLLLLATSETVMNHLDQMSESDREVYLRRAGQNSEVGSSPLIALCPLCWPFLPQENSSPVIKLADALHSGNNNILEGTPRFSRGFTAQVIMQSFDAEEFQEVLAQADYVIEDLEMPEEDVAILRNNGYIEGTAAVEPEAEPARKEKEKTEKKPANPKGAEKVPEKNPGKPEKGKPK